MKYKKIFMIILLIVFLAVIGIIFVKINNKSVEKISEKTNDSTKSMTIGTETKTSTSNMIEITDNFFIQQTNDIYLNLNDYIGKTIKIEGLVYSYEGKDENTNYAVVRNTPGCCGSDGLAGLDIRYDEKYPEKDTWVEVIGTVGKETAYGSDIPIIQVSSIHEKEKGTTFVNN